MSSRTNSGKKKIKRILPESASVPIKPQVVKVEFTPSPPQVIELKSEKRETRESAVNWDVIGFSSAAIVLLGAGLLFMMGWAYEVNWYGYFGVSMTEITMPPQAILIQSLPGIITIITVFLGVIGAELSSGNKFRNETVDWLRILLVTEALLALLLVWGYFVRSREFEGILDIYEFNYVVYIFIPIFMYIIFLPIDYIANRILKRRKVSSLPQVSFFMRNAPLRASLFVIIIIYIIFTSMTVSAMYAVSDASRGIQAGGNGKIQKIYLLSLEKLEVSETIIHECYDSHCLYGPFGLIGENDHQFMLIKWEMNKNQRFPYQPGLLIVPRGGLIIFPANDPL